MDPELFLSLGREALVLLVIASAPPLLASLLVGLLAALVQATTQVQESTLSSVPKLLASVGALVLAGPWIGQHLVRFTHELFAVLPQLHGG